MEIAAPQARAVLALCLLAAFTDGDKHAREREQIRQVAEGFGSIGPMELAGLYQDVLMGKVALHDVAAALDTPQLRQLGYEMAVCVCDADGVHSPAEQRFLAEARSVLGLDEVASQAFVDKAQQLAAAPLTIAPDAASPLQRTTESAVALPVIAASMAATEGPAGADPAAIAALDESILQASILNGALELLPESLSTLAIIPLQMKLVYRVGRAHGYELDSGHVKDLLATLGVGLSSQYLEQAGRKLLGGLLGKLGGGLLRGAGKQAVSSGMSFATTYALGQVAKRYYGGGRKLSADLLKETYQSTLQEAKTLATEHLPAMREHAGSLDAGKVLAMVRGA